MPPMDLKLVPEGENLTLERSQEKMNAIKNRLEKAKTDDKKRREEYPNKRTKNREALDAR